METQVLSIDQCKELVSLGLDMSDASCTWCPTYKHNGSLVDYDSIEDYNVIFRNNKTSIEALKEKYPLTFENVVYTYTLQDILKKLPKYITVDEYEYKWNIMPFHTQYVIQYLDTSGINPAYITFVTDTLIEAAFNMLKWCLENKYI